MSVDPYRLEGYEHQFDQRELELRAPAPTNKRRGSAGKNPALTRREVCLVRRQSDWFDPLYREFRLATCARLKAACRTCGSEPGTRPPSPQPFRESRGSRRSD